MKNILLQYMSERLINDHVDEKPLGPVITISREYGCGGRYMGDLLVDEINKIVKPKSLEQNWKMISKEIIEYAAKELHSKPEYISHIFDSKQRNMLGEIIVSFSNKQYASDDIIKSTITNVIRTTAEKGNAVIVGRAGCVITKHIEKSMHIQLVAPFEWRVEQIARKENISIIQARNMVKEIDQKRSAFLKYFKGDKPYSEIFDIILNRKKFSHQEILEIVMEIIHKKKMI